MIPLIGFLQGDCMGLLVFAQESDTIQEVAEKLVAAASVRVPVSGSLELQHKGRSLAKNGFVAKAGFNVLDRIDVRVNIGTMEKD